MTGLSLPLIATTTGGRNPAPYCPACLDRWQYGVPEVQRTPIHPACRDALEAIRSAPAEEA